MFAQYVALGDSMSIDLYPALDVGEAAVAVNLERRAEVGAVAPLGSASLFWRNDPRYWSEFAGNDLVTRWPEIRFQNLATDGATIGDVFGEQLPGIPAGAAPTLVTLTIGGNDLLSAYAGRPRSGVMERIVRDIGEAYEYLVGQVRAVLPNSWLLLTTVYDPSDRTGRIPGVFEETGPLPLQHLDAFNAQIRQLAAGTRDAALADVYAHFLGHGVSVEEKDRWYWRRSLIEPAARGASEIRRVWLDRLPALTARASRTA